MKHDADGLEIARRAARWAGLSLSPAQEQSLGGFVEWLQAEAIPAGGLGPNEGARLWGRHVSDSLTLACGWRDAPPQELLDVGTGVGLPGIPLAVAWPGTRVVLLDRAGRRIRLLRRAVRVLALPNVRLEQGDIFDVADRWQGLVFRGAIPPPEAVGLSSRLLDDRGRAVLALSRTRRPERLEDLLEVAKMLELEPELVSIPEEVLDGPSWILIIRRSGY